MQRTSHRYAFTHGVIRVVVMSTEHDFSEGSEQLSWIARELTDSPQRSRARWTIFTGHRPMYCDSDDDTRPNSDQVVATALRRYVEPLIAAAGVDLAMWGHHHSYQRSCRWCHHTYRHSHRTR